MKILKKLIKFDIFATKNTKIYMKKNYFAKQKSYLLKMLMILVEMTSFLLKLNYNPIDQSQ